MEEYSYQIRNILNSIIAKNTFENIEENTTDFEMLLLSFEFLKSAKNRLVNDLENSKIKKEYYQLLSIEQQIEKIIKNYV